MLASIEKRLASNDRGIIYDMMDGNFLILFVFLFRTAGVVL